MERSALDSVYQELILKHYRSSKHRGELEAPDAVVPMRNPVCGDDILLQVQVREGRISEIRFSGHGCAISQAAASMMSEHALGKSWDEVHAIAGRFREMIHGDETAARDKALGDMRALAGVAKLPRRVKCAMLAWDALDEAEKKIAP
ncbi:MAG: SUF system NifU family Fe-S cluster assembly protein, partial [Gemmatimonadetes bacterium]|nr:SUF system NifU family Fe-S cluster assembly protein [Gemmatimonadota bacterium]